MRFLRQNTAVIVTVGPFYDKTDGVTIETALTITNERITLTADTDNGSAPTNILDNVTGATSGTDNDLNYITGNDAGMMQLELSAANTNRVGRMLLSITDAANHVPVFHEFFVLPQAIYDWLTGVIVPLPANMTQILGTAVATPATAGVLDVNAKAVNNVATTSVTTISANVGTTQPINFTGTGASALAKSDMVDIAGAAVSTSVAQLGVNAVQVGAAPVTATTSITFPAACTVATTTGAVGSVTGAVGSVSGLTAATVHTDLVDIRARLPAALVGGRIDASVGAMASDVITAAATHADFGAEIADAVWDEAISGHLSAGTTGLALNSAGSAGDPWSTGLPGAYGAGSAGYILGTNLNATVSSRSSLDAAGVRTAVGLASANLDTQLTAIKAKTDNLPASPAAVSDIPTVSNILTTQMTESYAADGVAPTLAQALFMIQQSATEKSITGTTMTVKKLDGTTTAATFTLDSATAPTSITREG